MRIRDIKKDALASLKGRWGIAILLMIVTYAIYFIVPSTAEIIASGGFGVWINQENATPAASGLSTVVSLALAPLLLSFYWVFLDIRRGREVSIGTLFSNLSGKMYIKMIGLNLLVSIYTILWTLLLIIPGIVKGLAYSQTYFILKDNPGIVLNDAITQSRKLMDGYKGKYFLLNLSFIGWGLLCLLTLGIGFIWLAPYITASLASFYQRLIENRDAQIAGVLE
ncbi:hypothetical protein DRW41_16485 [Neobacillus piezotolerans]|uniref:DUF975 domain-containing protein n=1 Tax=Neobacillus piezotolerans TaxID=2259171 RepID=A0A3D8GN45_9BACI|nr:DUF975 family protein [Neobacillus piezotolerans]RDU35737.1 hypothetical protein DRW41_16485 [Neobacillus piezotolerans]